MASDLITMSATHNVYSTQSHLAVQDPDTPGPRYHTVIFVETDPASGSGFDHHVTGDLVTGMRYERRAAPRPEASATFHAMTWLWDGPRGAVPRRR